MSAKSSRRGLLVALALGLLVTPFFWALAQAADITVFAAASLKNALDDATKIYEAKTGDKVVVKYAASSTLALQIEEGLPARCVLLGRRRLDGLSRAEEIYRPRVAPHAARQHSGARRTEGLDRLTCDQEEFSPPAGARARWQACNGKCRY